MFAMLSIGEKVGFQSCDMQREPNMASLRNLLYIIISVPISFKPYWGGKQGYQAQLRFVCVCVCSLTVGSSSIVRYYPKRPFEHCKSP